MTELTLVGSRLAEVDETFVYRGETTACEECPYRDQCLNLEIGREYRVVQVRENAPLLECGVHDEGVVAVEVEPASVRANVPADRAFAGNRVELAGSCPHTGCPSHAFCEPAGADFDEEYRIESVVGDPPHDHCALGRELELVTLAPEK